MDVHGGDKEDWNKELFSGRTECLQMYTEETQEYFQDALSVMV